MRLITATSNALYCDTDQTLTAAACKVLLAHGIKGVWRYLSALTPAEITLILASGLELYFVNFARAAGWQASAAGGLADAIRDLDCLRGLGIPLGVHVAFDLEGPAPGIPAVINHVAAHGNKMIVSDYIPALYVGEGALLSSVQLMALPSELYWSGCSILEDAAGIAQVPHCGFAVVQGTPSEVVLDFGGGTKVTIDYDYVKKDFEGRLPIGVAA